jgi:protein tyrosine/serine phosphatase
MLNLCCKGEKVEKEEWSSCIHDFLVFGKYPNRKNFHRLILEEYITIFLNLTDIEYSIKNMKNYPQIDIISFPIEEGLVPDKEELKMLINEIFPLIFNSENNRKLYLHCEHGRGRSGLIANILVQEYLFRYLNNKDIDWIKAEANRIVNLSHQDGHGKNWKNKSIPPHKIQKKFIRDWKLNF